MLTHPATHSHPLCTRPCWQSQAPWCTPTQCPLGSDPSLPATTPLPQNLDSGLGQKDPRSLQVAMYSKDQLGEKLVLTGGWKGWSGRGRGGPQRPCQVG